MAASWMRGDRTPAWADLRAHFSASASVFDLRTAFASDAQRFEHFGVEAPHLYADLSKNWLEAPTLALLLRLAREVGLEGRRDAMFAGALLNNTEGRAVLHSALRAPRGTAPCSDDVHATLDAMLAFAERVRDTAHSGISDVVNIGIGGSDLGPQMAVPALQAYTQPGLRSHFVSNLDGHELAPLLTQLDPQRTLFIVASKTF
ncbi:MAG: glucose-6-phosphate isomerase, partial [Methylibium sp.]|nr:glucose-6-phosphate isomerase [Methylibium sp.]